jgi:Na+-transporting methylmalonyl-CoA/oxaloacetate decarboxylase gamma subunit
MENLGFGQILLLILFILVLLINFVMRRVRKPVESETPADEPVLDTPRRAQATPALYQHLMRPATECANCRHQLFSPRFPGVVFPSDRF